MQQASERAREIEEGGREGGRVGERERGRRRERERERVGGILVVRIFFRLAYH